MHAITHALTHTNTRRQGCSLGNRDSSVVRALNLWLKGHRFESRQEQQVFLLQGKFLCWLLSQYPLHVHVTTVAHKRSPSFCQKCRWQVTAKHACTSCMWLCMTWHGAWLHSGHRTGRDGSNFMWHLPCNNQTPLKYTTWVDIQYVL